MLEGLDEDEDKGTRKREKTHMGLRFEGTAFVLRGKYHCYHMPSENGLLK